MRFRPFSLPLVLMSSLYSGSYALAQQNDAASTEAQQAIQKIYDSTLYRSGTPKHPMSLHYPSSYKVDETSYVWLRTIKKLSLQDGKATVIIEYHDSLCATNPQTNEVSTFEAIDTNEDVWSQSEGKWISNQSKHLSSSYLIDGKDPDIFVIQPPKPDGNK